MARALLRRARQRSRNQRRSSRPAEPPRLPAVSRGCFVGLSFPRCSPAVVITHLFRSPCHHRSPHCRVNLRGRPHSHERTLYARTRARRVEREGYAALEALGATKLNRVDTAGGGAVNPTWTAMRQRLLGVPTGAHLGPSRGVSQKGGASTVGVAELVEGAAGIKERFSSASGAAVSS